MISLALSEVITVNTLLFWRTERGAEFNTALVATALCQIKWNKYYVLQAFFKLKINILSFLQYNYDATNWSIKVTVRQYLNLNSKSPQNNSQKLQHHPDKAL